MAPIVANRETSPYDYPLLEGYAICSRYGVAMIIHS